jgi:DNA-binding transcriptional MerR regulator
MTRSTQISIEELANELGCSRSLIRFWEDEFGLNLQTPNALSEIKVAEVRLIHQLIEQQGLSLPEAKDAFAFARPRLVAKYEAIEDLTRLRHALMSLKNHIDNRTSLA